MCNIIEKKSVFISVEMGLSQLIIFVERQSQRSLCVFIKLMSNILHFILPLEGCCAIKMSFLLFTQVLYEFKVVLNLS